MNTNRVFIGNIMKGNILIGSYVFLKINEDYILLEDINSVIDLLKLKCNYMHIRRFYINNGDDFYIDKDSLKPYYDRSGHRTLRRIKTDYMCDVRNPRGIER